MNCINVLPSAVARHIAQLYNTIFVNIDAVSRNSAVCDKIARTMPDERTAERREAYDRASGFMKAAESRIAAAEHDLFAMYGIAVVASRFDTRAAAFSSEAVKSAFAERTSAMLLEQQLLQDIATVATPRV